MTACNLSCREQPRAHAVPVPTALVFSSTWNVRTTHNGHKRTNGREKRRLPSQTKKRSKSNHKRRASGHISSCISSQSVRISLLGQRGHTHSTQTGVAPLRGAPGRVPRVRATPTMTPRRLTLTLTPPRAAWPAWPCAVAVRRAVGVAASVPSVRAGLGGSSAPRETRRAGAARAGGTVFKPY